MSPFEILDPVLRRRQTQQHLGFKRLDLVPFRVFQRLSSLIDIPSGRNVDTDDRDLVESDMVKDGMIRWSNRWMEGEP
jgi:hypothetical protein